jgi:PPM family protein phosphatase
LGLLRVGAVNGGLKRELQLREILGEHKMIARLIAWMQTLVNSDREKNLNIDNPTEISTSKEPINTSENDLLLTSSEEVIETSQKDENKILEMPAMPIGKAIANTSTTENSSQLEISESELEYLEEEFYEEKEIGSNQTGEKLFLLTEMPRLETTLDTWLRQKHSLDSSLLLISQICQFFRYIYQRNWCVTTIFPQFMQMGTPVQFFDLTGVYPVGEKLDSGFIGNYYPPEIAYGHTINEQMSSYLVGVLLYQTLYQKLPPSFDGITDIENLDININKIPRLYQLITIALSPSPEDRFSLEQLLNLLVETRRNLKSFKLHWQIATHSTVGLSTNRLQNEDSYGIRQEANSYTEPLLLAVVADGMGGMAQGEVASQLAVKTILESPIPTNLTNANPREEWLISLIEKANLVVSENVRNGGTTISLVAAVGNELSIAHVGDSRILLLRNEKIHQLSEDHSLVAMLLAESINHPDRSVLTKSLGAKPRLSEGYVQTINRFNSQSSLTLEDKDILLLCSDGVWDLITSNEFVLIFNNTQDLQGAVNTIIERVLEKGANDNATILALQCHLENFSF